VVPKNAEGKHLVIVESPTKAKTINKYLGPDYVVMASVGHVRDLPTKNPKGVKDPVPGVDLEHDFAPTYEVMPGKKETVTALRKVAKHAADVWFATDLDREGEAIAWHLAHSLDVPLNRAKRVVFNAITQREIQEAFAKPRRIDESKVNAQQARRILDRIVGYQVSPLLWKKVAGGLSAGRVQSVATRLVVEREREIEAFIPEEFWRITGLFAVEVKQAAALAQAWRHFIDVDRHDEKANPRSVKEQIAWLSERHCIKAELVEVKGESFKPESRDEALAVAQALGFVVDETKEWQDPKGKGPGRFLAEYHGHVALDAAGGTSGGVSGGASGGAPGYRIRSIETRRTSSKPSAPFITSTLQQQAANRLGFPLQKTMRIAQQLYEGLDIHGIEGQTGLITYMRTDSTHLSPEAVQMARSYIATEPGWGEKYLPDKPNVYTSSNKMAQEAHEAIRPTDVKLTPKRVQKYLNDDQYKLYRLIWERFLGCQMVPAQWDSTTVLIEADRAGAVFKATGRTLVFDGFYKAVGMPQGDELTLPPLREQQPVAPISIDPTQHFTAPPPRYTEASLQKKLEEEGIGRPSTYAAIISTIQDRKYVEPLNPRDRRLRATDLGKVVTDMLTEAFPTVMDVAYTRDMEAELDKIEEEQHDWVKMLHAFYGPFKERLDAAHENMQHAKAAMEPAPFPCGKCGAPTVYRFGKSGRFLSCSRYPECNYAAPIDAEGNPQEPELTDVLCPEDDEPMIRRNGRFGPFLASRTYPAVKYILKLDPKKGTVVLPKPPPLAIDIVCPKCGAPLNMRRSKRGPWLSCSRFPKCRGRVGFTSLEEPKQQELEAALAKHEQDNPVPTIRNTAGQVVEEGYAPRILAVESGGSGNSGGSGGSGGTDAAENRSDSPVDTDAAA
jgi:DNA topoisomerase-1